MRFVLLSLFVASSAFAQDPAKAPEKLIDTFAGTLPIIISCPHDGTKAIPDVPIRVGTGIEKFVVVRDTNAGLIAEELAAELEKRFKARPYLVIARFGRKYVDVNRPADSAYESEKAKPYYEGYHALLKDYSQAVHKKWRRGILLDIHGQAAETETVFRGTNNLKTVKALVTRYGKPAVVGEKSILGHMAKNGVKVFPACDSDDPEDKRYGGGHIVQTYGSHTAYAIDAIQLETGGTQRGKGRKEFVMKFADAVEVFAREYLPLDAEQPKDQK
jgi:N-formylglutamate amidohydrolase